MSSEKPDLLLIDAQQDAEKHMIAELKRHTRLGIRHNREDRLLELSVPPDKVMMAVRTRYELNYKLMAWQYPDFILVQGPQAIALMERFIRA